MTSQESTLSLHRGEIRSTSGESAYGLPLIIKDITNRIECPHTATGHYPMSDRMEWFFKTVSRTRITK